MTIKEDQYVPVLKFRMAEYQALNRIQSSYSKDKVVPLLVIPPIEYDFEEKRLKKTVPEHIEPFVKRLKKKWGNRLALIDMHDEFEGSTLDNGKNACGYIFNQIKKEGCNVVPVVDLNKTNDYLKVIKSVIKEQEKGVAIRVKLKEIREIHFSVKYKKLINELDITPRDIDLIIDLGAPESYEPYNAFANLILQSCEHAFDLEKYRSLVITSFSLNTQKIKKPVGEAPRHEWQLYNELVGVFKKSRTPTYGDYAIETPDFVSNDMRLMQPPGKIVYTTEDGWYIPKGGAFRLDTSQMKEHCTKILDSGYFKGEGYSWGDKRIYDTAKGKCFKTSGDNQGELNFGNLTTWKQVGLNHHFELVIKQVSSFHAKEKLP